MSGRGVIHQPPFLHPELDHAIQGAAFHTQPTAEFTEMQGAVGGFDFVEELVEHGGYWVLGTGDWVLDTGYFHAPIIPNT